MKRFENVVAYAFGGVILLGIVLPIFCQWPAVQSSLQQATNGQLSLDSAQLVLLFPYCSFKGAVVGAYIGGANGWYRPIAAK
jgi:hypothetical protein